MKCREVTGFLSACLDAYVDGELDDRDCGELEAHLAECESCREAVRNQARLKALIRERASTVRAPEGLVSRIQACLDEADLEERAEDATVLARNEGVSSEPKPALPPALATLDELPLAPHGARGSRGNYFRDPRESMRCGCEAQGAWLSQSCGSDEQRGRTQMQRRPKSGSHSLASPQVPSQKWRSMPLFASMAFLLVFVWVAAGGFTHDPLVDDAVRKHARGLPLEVTGPAESLQRWLRDKVDFKPEVLVFPSGLEPLGARLSHVREHPAVYIGYGRPGSGPDGERQASLFVFCDPSFDPTLERYRHRHVAGRSMVITNKNGFNVLLWKENEVVYSLVSDLEERELFELIQAASTQ